MTFLAFLLVSPVLAFGGGSPELTASATAEHLMNRLVRSADESVHEVLIIRSSCSGYFGPCPTSGCLDSDTLTMKSCSEANNPQSDCQKECGSFHLTKHGSDVHGYFSLRVGDDHDAAYLNIGQDPGAVANKLQKKPYPYEWQSAQFQQSRLLGPRTSFLCNKFSGEDDALCINDQGGVSNLRNLGNVWLARYDNGQQIICSPSY